MFKSGFKTNDAFAFNFGCKDALGKRESRVLRDFDLKKNDNTASNRKIKGCVGSKCRGIVNTSFGD